MSVFLAHFLFVLSAWTLVIKFVLPMVWAADAGLPLGELIYWDFWWVAHIWLGWALLTRPRYLLWLAVAVASLEIVIVLVKFALFLTEPQWTIWTMNWFVNKLFVLACFMLMTVHVVVRTDYYRGVDDGRD